MNRYIRILRHVNLPSLPTIALVHYGLSGQHVTDHRPLLSSRRHHRGVVIYNPNAPTTSRTTNRRIIHLPSTGPLTVESYTFLQQNHRPAIRCETSYFEYSTGVPRTDHPVRSLTNKHWSTDNNVAARATRFPRLYELRSDPRNHQ